MSSSDHFSFSIKNHPVVGVQDMKPENLSSKAEVSDSKRDMRAYLATSLIMQREKQSKYLRWRKISLPPAVTFLQNLSKSQL